MSPAARAASPDVLPAWIDHWAAEAPERVWLRDRAGDAVREWTWAEARAEVDAVAAALERRFGSGAGMAILSRNRAHWVLADLAIIASGSVAIPIFTTLPAATARYVLEFSEARVLFLGEAESWSAVAPVVPAGVTIVCFPGVEVAAPHLRWDDLAAEGAGARPAYACRPADLVSLVFTSGTTGVPKGVMQTHESMLVPVARFTPAFGIRAAPRFLSYLPLSHIAERQLVAGASLTTGGVVTFNEGLPTLVRDLQATRPTFFFGPPRVWEQLQQIVVGRFGSPDAAEAALAADPAGTRAAVAGMLGLDDCDYCLTAAAPTPPALIAWFDRFGIALCEGFGQTEAMGLTACTAAERRVGSIGKPLDGVAWRISEEDELLVRASGLTPGYYRMPDKTAELYRDGWLHTGDKARVDEDGFIFLTGRVKDYFKTIQGKFVAPVPIESVFAACAHAEQVCLLGRGYSKTVMVCVLAPRARDGAREEIAAALRAEVARINREVEKHARIGAVILSTEPWTIANEILTPTLKIRRERVEARFGAAAERLARQAAEQGTVLIEWEEAE